MTPQPLRLFHPQFADHIDATTQVDRMPGSVSAPCLHPDPRAECLWPFCTCCKPPEEEDE